MTSWKARLQYLIESADKLSDEFRARLNRIGGIAGPFMIMPYIGYGNSERLWVAGRVLADQGFNPSSSADRTWRNLLNMYKRFETDEVPGARVRARFGTTQAEATADREGYFNFEITPNAPLAQPWQPVHLELLEPRPENGSPVRAMGQVLVPSNSAKFGAISDVDDTIIASNVTRKLQMLLTVILSNEHRRKPFEGVAAFYRALQQGSSGSEENPIFYVSSSPWNLYMLLIEFLRIQDIPLGPLLLRDFGDHLLFERSSRAHKLIHIERLLRAFPHLPFVLIGDSGEQDPEIYSEIVKQYPNRVRVIYIRAVNRDPARIAAIDTLINEVKETGAQLVLAPDSEFAAAHAAGEGLIAAAALARIRSEKQADRSAPAQTRGNPKGR